MVEVSVDTTSKTLIFFFPRIPKLPNSVLTVDFFPGIGVVGLSVRKTKYICMSDCLITKNVAAFGTEKYAVNNEPANRSRNQQS